MSLICKDSNELEKDLLREEVTRKGIDYGETGVEIFLGVRGGGRQKRRTEDPATMVWNGDVVVLRGERWVVVVGHM